MPEVSLREHLLRHRPELDLALGLRHTFLHPWYTAHPEAFPYPSLSAMLKALEWPSRYELLDDDPDALTNPGGEEPQGLTQNDTHWFMTSRYTLHRIVGSDDWTQYTTLADLRLPLEGTPWRPVRGDLEALREVNRVLQGYDHLGDCTHHQGRLYVPLQGPSRTVGMAVFDAATGALLGAPAMEVEHPRGGAWCAINPLNGLLYVSDFYEMTDLRNAVLRVYRIAPPGEPIGFTLLGSFELFDENGAPIHLLRIQGGVFSPGGHLYLVSDCRLNHRDAGFSPRSGIYGFDMISGRKRVHLPVGYSPGGLESDELEGMTVWDRGSRGELRYSGQLHLVLCDNDLDATGRDEVYIKHWRVPEADRSKV